MDGRFLAFLVCLTACITMCGKLFARAKLINLQALDRNVGNQTETTNFTLQPSITLPARSVGRHCSSQLFKLTTASDNHQHHLIGFTAISDGATARNPVRRMLLLGCGGEMSDGATVTKECEDITQQSSCHLIGAWSPGYLEDRFYPNTGIRIGTGGYPVLVLEVQWKNPSAEEVVLGEAGMTLYTTSQMGLQEAAMLEVGNERVVIQPNTVITDVTSSCSSTCIRSLLPGQVLVTAAISRMNLMGTRQEVSIVRDRKFLQHVFVADLTSDTGDRQFSFKDPIRLLPGDEVKTKCSYSSLNATRTTFSTNGALEDSELCLAYLRYHSPQHNPPTAFTSCLSWMSLLACDPATEHGCTSKEREKFRSENLPMTRSYNDVNGKCPGFGVCTAECKDAILAAREREPCMSHTESWERVKTTILAHSHFGRHFLAALASCEIDLYKDAAAASRKNEAESLAKDGEGQNTIDKPALAISRRKHDCKSRGHSMDQQNQLIWTVSFLIAICSLFQ